MKVLCIIPARSGSKSIKDKNLKKIDDKSLIELAISFSKKIKFINKTIFSSDSKKYIKIASKLKIDVSLRPSKYSKDNSNVIDLIKYEINREKKLFLKTYDLILLLQPTSPFRNVKDFISAYKFLKQRKADSVLTLSEAPSQPERMMVKKKSYYVGYNNNFSFKNRQKLKKIYIRAGSMYFFNIDNIKKYDSILGKKVRGIVVKDKYMINIDNKSDLILAQNYKKF